MELSSGTGSSAQRHEPRHLLLGLQYLRAIATLQIIYFHAVLQINILVGDAGFFPLLGSFGVDIFFVLSGFMMWYSSTGRSMTPMGFFGRRLLRIVPLYWLITLVALAVVLIAPSLLRSTVFDPAHSLASFLFIPWPNPAAVSAGAAEVLIPVVVPGWTLNFEMIFYFLYALTLALPSRFRLIAISVLLLALFLIAGLAKTILPIAGFYHNSILFEFLAGVALGAATLDRRPLNTYVAGAFFVAAFVTMLLVEIWVDPAKVPRIIAFGIPATVVIAMTLRREAGRPLPVISWLNEWGDASYSIYLTHVFVLAALRVIVMKLGLAHDGPVFQWAFLAVAMAVSVSVGVVTYRCIERPSMQLAKRWLMPSRKPQPIAVG